MGTLAGELDCEGRCGPRLAVSVGLTHRCTSGGAENEHLCIPSVTSVDTEAAVKTLFSQVAGGGSTPEQGTSLQTVQLPSMVEFIEALLPPVCADDTHA